jgi:cation diffusion facilitator CzcD-associated flavoprotein CzcO/alkylhydroperoxidase/carboxymuconolactone decarboxylase family protein YurZ
VSVTLPLHDVLVVGAGVTGLNQLHRCVEEGFDTVLLEAGTGVGGTWFWNRYPEARFDSESYTYGFLFSEELFREWDWSEEYAGQPEVERYFNHVVDRFDLRRHIRFGAAVDSAVFDELAGTWTVTTAAGEVYRARFVVAATGVLSVPFRPDIPGQDVFRGPQFHTGRWPAEPVDLAGKRVALIGTGSSGVQIVPAVSDVVERLFVFQRTPDWVTPLNNAPLPPGRMAELQADFAAVKEHLDGSPSGFLHALPSIRSEEHDAEQRREFFEKLYASGGFRKLSENYLDFTTNPEVNAEWCAFLAEKIRETVHDPEVAEALIPKDHGYGGRRPPFGTGYYEAYNAPSVELVVTRDNEIVRLTETGVETADGVVREVDLVVWGTGWDFGTGALNRIGARGRGGAALEDHWKDGPRTYLGLATAGFPNLFFPGGPHGSSGNNPRYNEDQVEFVLGLLRRARERGAATVEVTEAAEAEWTELMDTTPNRAGFLESSYFFGANIPGKPVKQLLNPTGRWHMKALMREAEAADYPTFVLGGAAPEDLRRLGYNTMVEIVGRAYPPAKPRLGPDDPIPDRRDGRIADEAVQIGDVSVWSQLWARPGLSHRDRSLVTLGILLALGAEDEFGSHVRIGLGNGLTREEISEVVYHGAGYAGFPRAMAARKAARTALGEDSPPRKEQR